MTVKEMKNRINEICDLPAGQKLLEKLELEGLRSYWSMFCYANPQNVAYVYTNMEETHRGIGFKSKATKEQIEDVYSLLSLRIN